MNCVACGSDIGDDAKRCPSCGLVIAAETEAQAVARETALPVAPGDGAAADTERETPIVERKRMPLSPRARLWRRMTLSLVVVAVVAAVVAAIAIVRAHRPDDRWTQIEDVYARFLDSPAFRRTGVPAAFDPDAAVAEFGRDEPDALRAAASAHVPFVPPPGAGVHQVFDAFLPRLLAVLPAWSFRLGIHPHPTAFPRPDAATFARSLLLVRDLCRALHDGLDAARLTPHERADREALLAWTEFELRRHAVPDVDALATMKRCVDPLIHLAEIHCCPETERCDAATAVLESIPEVLSACEAQLRQPPYALVDATARELDDVAAWLPSYPKSFASAARPSHERLALAAAMAGAALAETAKHLRGNPHRRTTGEIGIGAENADLVLRVYHRLPFGARDVYERALEALRDARDDMRSLMKQLRDAREPLDRDPDETQVRGLRDACADWVTALPPDEGLSVRPRPGSYAHRTSAAAYLDPGSMLPAEGGVVLIGPVPEARPGFQGNYAAVTRRHTLAHETYPGHRMEAVFRRSACPLRRFIDDRVFVEGWAVYATEDVLHEMNRCSSGPTDAYVRACERAERAEHAMDSLLIETAAAGTDEVSVLLSMRRGSLISEADLGEHESTTLYAVDYFVGADEIRRLRRFEEQRLGSAFDLKAFHAKLLSEGPIPPRLIEDEWRAQAR